MSRSKNLVILIGTLGRDPEVKNLPSGSVVANVSLATDEGYNDKQSGQKVEKTEWHRVTAYGKLAEIIGQYLKKGSRVYFEGKLQTNEWEKDGVKRYTTEIVVNDMLMFDSRSNDGMAAGGFQQQGHGGFQPQQPSQQAPQQQQGGFQPQQPSQQAPQQQQGGFQPQQAPQQAPQQGGYQPQNAPQQGHGGFQPQQPAPRQPTPRQPHQGGGWPENQ
jgi:single-strand DNA-binding protein